MLVQATILFYKKGEKSFIDKGFIDIDITDKDVNINRFIRRLKIDEGLEERARSQFGFEEISIKVGYCQKTGPGLGPMIESWTDQQFKICREKLENSTTNVLTVKVEDNTQTFLGPSSIRSAPKHKPCCSQSSEPEVVDLSLTDTTEEQEQEEPPKKKKRRNKEDVALDNILWQSLTSGSVVVERNERQEDRLQKFISNVTEKYEDKYTVLNEKFIQCNTCKKSFTVNKFNAIENVGKCHKICIKNTMKQTSICFKPVSNQ